MLKSLINTETKDKGKKKRKSKGERTHIRRLKQAERKESLPAPIKR